MFKIVLLGIAFTFYFCFLNGGIAVALLGTSYVCLILALCGVIENIVYQKKMSKKN